MLYDLWGVKVVCCGGFCGLVGECVVAALSVGGYHELSVSVW